MDVLLDLWLAVTMLGTDKHAFPRIMNTWYLVGIIMHDEPAEVLLFYRCFCY